MLVPEVIKEIAVEKWMRTNYSTQIKVMLVGCAGFWVVFQLWKDHKFHVRMRIWSKMWFKLFMHTGHFPYYCNNSCSVYLKQGLIPPHPSHTSLAGVIDYINLALFCDSHSFWGAAPRWPDPLLRRSITVFSHICNCPC